MPNPKLCLPIFAARGKALAVRTNRKSEVKTRVRIKREPQTRIEQRDVALLRLRSSVVPSTEWVVVTACIASKMLRSGLGSKLAIALAASSCAVASLCCAMAFASDFCATSAFDTAVACGCTASCALDAAAAAFSFARSPKKNARPANNNANTNAPTRIYARCRNCFSPASRFSANFCAVRNSLLLFFFLSRFFLFIIHRRVQKRAFVYVQRIRVVRGEFLGLRQPRAAIQRARIAFQQFPFLRRFGQTGDAAAALRGLDSTIRASRGHSRINASCATSAVSSPSVIKRASARCSTLRAFHLRFPRSGINSSNEARRRVSSVPSPNSVNRRKMLRAISCSFGRAVFRTRRSAVCAIAPRTPPASG